MKRHFLHIIFLMLMSLAATRAVAQGDSKWGMGVPFFENYAASKYKAHNRNFDVLCDEQGHVFFANFEGLLAYNQAEWQVIHTPGISRIVDLEVGKDGKVWFTGANVKGYVESMEGDSVQLHFVESDAGKTNVTTERMRREQGEVDRWKDVEVYQRLPISNTRTLLATATEGVIAIDADGQEVWRISTENGLCSNSVTKLAYDGKGSVWGATDNGVFRIFTSEIYTHFGENEGLRGQISCIAKSNNVLMVGTFQGLFRLQGQRFHQVEGVAHACWQLEPNGSGGLLAATSDGVYEYADGNARQKTQQFALSLMRMEDGSWLVGELEQVCRYDKGGGREVLGDLANVVRFKKDGKGGVWAMTLTGEYYYLASGANHFESMREGPISRLFEYEDDKGNIWKSNDNGIGVSSEGMPDNLKRWVQVFSNFNVQAMLIDDGIAWIGNNEGLVRFDIEGCLTTKTFEPKVFIRTFSINGRDLSFSFSNDKKDPIGTTLYSYRLHDGDAWSKWSEQQSLLFANLSYGNYQLKVRSKDAFGQESESETFKFEVPLPFYFSWYAVLLYVAIIVLLIYQLFRYRMRRLEAEQQRLEAIVDERTREVVKQKDEIEAQKDEIEEKSHKLEDALGELRSAQNQLLRQEREAAIGKLTKGLIDRILNPLNYINNFSHLTLGLSKDMKANLEDDQEQMTPDIYEDSMDVMDMMQTNLEKIEQHGLSTTRILKAMEEMLKERSQKIEPTDVALLCQQSVEMMKNYYAKDIQELGIDVQWQKPQLPIVADIVSELFNKVIMSMLVNSIYAIRKKAEKNTAYHPLLRVTVTPPDGEQAPVITVYDNGIGIEESILDKVFDPFFTTKPTAEAPGVGLYLSQQAVHDWGGNITVRSVKDEFTEFVIELP